MSKVVEEMEGEPGVGKKVQDLELENKRKKKQKRPEIENSDSASTPKTLLYK